MQALNVLLIGSGGREHSLAWAISRSSFLKHLYIAPGNPATADLGSNLTLNVSDHAEVLTFCKDQNIDLVIVGPEQPLVDGITNYLTEEGILVFGPDDVGARLEGSKSFAKEIMAKYGVPTADHLTFVDENLQDAEQWILEHDVFPVVLKADGLAAGKGVFISTSKEEAFEHLSEIRNSPSLSGAASKLVIEEFMQGEEASVFAICDGENFVVLPAAQDHKRIGDDDTGPNTGGMGAYSPAPVMTEELMESVKNDVIKPMLYGMQKEGHPYKGALYVGLMIKDEKAKVVEFNCRFGDPECQILMPKITSDVLELLYRAASGTLPEYNLTFDEKTWVCVVMASKGYPGSYPKGYEITGFQNLKSDQLVFHAGTSKDSEGKLVTSGGRVLAFTASGDDLLSAIKNAYDGVSQISFKDAYYRKDIGQKGLRH